MRFLPGTLIFGFVCGSGLMLAQTSTPIPAASVEHIGKNGVLAPIVLVAPNPEYSKVARKDKVSGKVLVHLEVGVDGLPTNVRIVRGVGYGLDEKAIEAVKAYRFKPALRDGVPVRVEMNVEVNFQIYGKERS